MAASARYTPYAIRAGLPFEVLERLIMLFSLPHHEAAALLLISDRTLARRRREQCLSHAESDRLVRYLALVDETIAAFDGDQEAAVAWLTTGKQMLGDETPLQYADTEPGLRAVRDMLGVIDYGLAG